MDKQITLVVEKLGLDRNNMDDGMIKRLDEIDRILDWLDLSELKDTEKGIRLGQCIQELIKLIPARYFTDFTMKEKEFFEWLSKRQKT